jgi:SAM-dependent methyltransferase
MGASVGPTEAHRHKKGGTWIEYWKRGDSSSETVSKINIDFFLKATSKIMEFNCNDIVLDVGSGYCHLAVALKDFVKEIHCADISEFYLRRGIEELAGVDNVFFHKLKEDEYTELGLLGFTTFSKIVSLSVVQYYRGIEELEDLISEVGKLADRNAKFLIADIPTSKPGFMDVLKTIVHAGLNRKFTDACLLFLKGFFGTYRQASRQVGLLTLTRAQIKEMAERLHLKFQILDDPLTTNFGRVHLLIEF